MSVAKKTTFYDILSIDKSASVDEVRKAYRKRALETHPDKLDPSATEEEKQAAEREFPKVHEAFQTLGDPLKKRRYDAVLALRLDPKLVSKHGSGLMADRREWARQQEELARRRMEDWKARQGRLEGFKAAPLRSAPVTPAATEKVEKPPVQLPASRELTAREREEQRVSELLNNLYPDMAARRRVILQRRAEREQAEKEKALAQLEPPLTA
ncbi:DnaJ domain-containing protein [Coprinopsis cinerea AmutBmut pab1-1]|nr:DnaJ domain-containing protein [Coprinopsis cinerea AmutBmut pab1-1]